MAVTTRQASSTRELNRRRDVHERRIRGHDLLASTPRRHTLGIRASDLPSALADADAMEAQSPTTPIQKVILQRMRVLPPDDLTARDQALWHLMLTVWRDDVDRQAPLDDGEHVITFEIVRRYLGVEDDRQIIDSMFRLGKTLIMFDVDTEFFKNLGIMSMVLGYVRIDKRNGRKQIRFTIPEQLQRILGSCLSYAYVELAAWPKFKTKFSGRLYGFLASYRPQTITGGAVTVDVPVDELQDILGGGEAQKGHYGSWKRRVLVPAVNGVLAAAKRLTITDWDETHGAGSGSPVESVRFYVRYQESMTPEICPGIPEIDKFGNHTAKQIIAELKAGDPIHAPELFPSVPDVGRTMHALDELTGNYFAYHTVVKFWSHALDEAYYGIVLEYIVDPNAGSLFGTALRRAIDTKGVRTAFAMWCASEIRHPRFIRLEVKPRDPDGFRTQHADAIKRGEIPDGFKRSA